MIRRLRIKFIAIIMTMLTVLLLVIFCSLNYMMVKSGRSQSYERMERVAESDGGAAREASVSPFGYSGEIRIFTPMPRDDGIYYVKLTRDGLISEMFVPYEDFISKDGVTKLVSEVLKAGKERGKLGNQLYIVREKDYGSIIVFSDEQALQRLNAITHRCVDREVQRRLEDFATSGGRIAAIDAIELFAGNQARRCQATLAVLAKPEVRAERIMQRDGISREYAMLRIQAQRPDSYFEGLCDYILRNDGSPAEF